MIFLNMFFACDRDCNCGCNCGNSQGARRIYVNTLTGITGPTGATEQVP